MPNVVKQSEQNRARSWRDTVSEATYNRLSVLDRKRRHAIFEFIQTETTFVNDLNLILSTYVIDYEKKEGAHLFSEEDQALVFDSWGKLGVVSTGFLSELKNRETEGDGVVAGVADLFIKHLPAAEPEYIAFISRLPTIREHIRKKGDSDAQFKQMMDNKKRECRNLDLNSYLLEPLQRLTRYPLLLREIMKTVPQTDPALMARSRCTWQ